MKKVVLRCGRTVSSKINKARLVRQSMADNAADFPDPEPSLQEIADKVDQLEEAQAAAQQGGTDRTIVRDARLAELTLLMQREVLYVQRVTNGVPELVAKAGMDVEEDRTKWPLPEKVKVFRADPGGNPETVLLRAKKPNFKRMFVFQQFVEGRWETIAVQGRGKLLVEGLVSGSHHRFRVAAINAAGMGDFSDEVTCVAR